MPACPERRRRAIAAAILAGGRGTRLGGVDKAALIVGTRRIVEHQLSILSRVASTVFIVGGEPGSRVDLGIPVVADDIAGAGALGGIYTAIVRSPEPRTLVVGCDMPFLNAGVLELLADVASRGADVVIPRSDAGYEPLCAVYSRACAEPIRRRIERGELKAVFPFDGLRVEEIGPERLKVLDPDGLMFTNVNTPHDYDRARSLIELQTKPNEDRITND